MEHETPLNRADAAAIRRCAPLWEEVIDRGAVAYAQKAAVAGQNGFVFLWNDSQPARDFAVYFFLAVGGATTIAMDFFRLTALTGTRLGPGFPANFKTGQPPGSIYTGSVVGATGDLLLHIPAGTLMPMQLGRPLFIVPPGVGFGVSNPTVNVTVYLNVMWAPL